MARYEWAGIFDLDLPGEWGIAEEDGVVTLRRDESVGALQISLWRHTDVREIDLTEIADSFLEHLDATAADKQSVHINGAPAIRTRSVVDGQFWDVWHIAGPTHLALVTYNSDEGDAEIEATTRESIVGSWRWQTRRSES